MKPDDQTGSEELLAIDGSAGEGGGQILRSSLSLSLVTGRAFRLFNIRARRQRPGLQAQHLAAVRAASAVGQAEVRGDSAGSREITFRPAAVAPGDYAFDVGTAGSALLVLQTVLPPLLLASDPSSLLIEGGTHNPMAPPFEFIARTFLPLVERMGPRVQAKLDRHGFYPAGGGKIRATIQPGPALARLDLPERVEWRRRRAASLVANLPRHVAERELKVLKRGLGLNPRDQRVEERQARSPGNVAFVELESDELTEVFTSFGELGLPAETVAARLVDSVGQFLEAGAPVGEHLADQLLLPMALAGGGSFYTAPLSLHARTNIDVLELFLPVEVHVTPASDRSVRVEVRPAVKPRDIAAAGTAP
jgi:RNA 3'-terminal phosphate cyclase (ATP)